MNSFLKSAILMALLVTFFHSKSIAQAASKEEPEWVYVTETEDAKIYLRSECVSKEYGKIKIWEKWIYNKPQKLNGKLYTKYSEKELTIIDCKESKRCILSIVYYSDNEVIDNYTADYQTWRDIVPGSVGEKLLRTVCNWFN